MKTITKYAAMMQTAPVHGEPSLYEAGGLTFDTAAEAAAFHAANEYIHLCREAFPNGGGPVFVGVQKVKVPAPVKRKASAEVLRERRAERREIRGER